MRKWRPKEVKWLFNITSLDSRWASSWENLLELNPIFVSTRRYWGDHRSEWTVWDRVALLTPWTNRSLVKLYYLNNKISILFWFLPFVGIECFSQVKISYQSFIILDVRQFYSTCILVHEIFI